MRLSFARSSKALSRRRHPSISRFSLAMTARRTAHWKAWAILRSVFWNRLIRDLPRWVHDLSMGDSPCYRRPRTLASLQRTPTKRNRQSLRNSGGFPSKACPMNWRAHPATNIAVGSSDQSRWERARANRGKDKAINEIPTRWQNWFTRFWWLSAYCATRSSLESKRQMFKHSVHRSSRTGRSSSKARGEASRCSW